VTNVSHDPITAVVVTGRRIFESQHDTSVRFFDSVLSSRNPRPLSPGGSLDFQFFGPQPPPENTTRSIEVKAVLFDNGESWGDPQWVAKLVRRRAYAHAQAAALLSEIADAKATNASRPETVLRLERKRSEMMVNSRDVDERQMADILFSNALLIISRSSERGGSETSVEDSLNASAASVAMLRRRLERAKPLVEP
jgi:hypothetical protein